MIAILIASLISQTVPAAEQAAPVAVEESVYPKPETAELAKTEVVPKAEPPREDPIVSGKLVPVQDAYIIKATGKFWLPPGLTTVKDTMTPAELLTLVPILKWDTHDNGVIRLRVVVPDELLLFFAKQLKDGIWVILDEPIRTAPKDRWYDDGVYFLTLMASGLKYTPRTKPLKADEKHGLVSWTDWIKSRAQSHSVLPVAKGWKTLPKVNQVPELKERVKIELKNLVFTMDKIDLQAAKTERMFALHEKEQAYIMYYNMGCEEAGTNQEWNNTHPDIKQHRDAYKSEEHFDQCASMFADYRKFAALEYQWDKRIDKLKLDIEKMKTSIIELDHIEPVAEGDESKPKPEATAVY